MKKYVFALSPVLLLCEEQYISWDVNIQTYTSSPIFMSSRGNILCTLIFSLTLLSTHRLQNYRAEAQSRHLSSNVQSNSLPSMQKQQARIMWFSGPTDQEIAWKTSTGAAQSQSSSGLSVWVTSSTIRLQYRLRDSHPETHAVKRVPNWSISHPSGC